MSSLPKRAEFSRLGLVSRGSRNCEEVTYLLKRAEFGRFGLASSEPENKVKWRWVGGKPIIVRDFSWGWRMLEIATRLSPIISNKGSNPTFRVQRHNSRYRLGCSQRLCRQQSSLHLIQHWNCLQESKNQQRSAGNRDITTQTIYSLNLLDKTVSHPKMRCQNVGRVLNGKYNVVA